MTDKFVDVVLGQGAFGKVERALATGLNGSQLTTVAVKSAKGY